VNPPDSIGEVINRVFSQKSGFGGVKDVGSSKARMPILKPISHDVPIPDSSR
jgi:hypothetical protein